MKLSEAQRNMLAVCIQTGRAWATAPGCENHLLLEELEKAGFAESVAHAPASLVAYRITPAGRAALEGSEK